MFRYSLPCVISLLDGVLYSMPAADILTAILSFVVILKTYRELNSAIKTAVITIDIIAVGAYTFCGRNKNDFKRKKIILN